MIRSYRDLVVWQEGMNLAEACYLLARSWPMEERFSLTAQVRRSAASIPANIAEGFGRGSRKGYLQFIYISQGSLYETETHLLLASRVGVCPTEAASPLLATSDLLGRRLNALVRALKT